MKLCLQARNFGNPIYTKIRLKHQDILCNRELCNECSRKNRFIPFCTSKCLLTIFFFFTLINACFTIASHELHNIMDVFPNIQLVYSKGLLYMNTG
jgi:hypothetical protein